MIDKEIFNNGIDEELKKAIDEGLRKEFAGDLSDYLKRYQYTLSKVKYLLDLVKELLVDVDQQLDVFKQQIEHNQDSNEIQSCNDTYTKQMVIALYLRQILELMLSRFIGNNDKLLKDKIDSKNGRYKRLIEQLEITNKEIIRIHKKPKINIKGDQLEFIFSPNVFWTKDNLIKVYDKLSYDYLHYSHELHENFKILVADGMKDFLQKVYDLSYDSFKYLSQIYESIFESLQNHSSFINIDSDVSQYIFEIENFEIKIFYPKSVINYERIK